MSKVFKAVGNAVSSVVKGVVKAVSSVVKAVVNVVSSVVNFVVQPFMGLLGGTPDIPTSQAETERQQGVLLQTQGSVVNVPVVYGYRKVGGAVVFAETGSTNNKYLYVAYVFSEGLVEGLREVFIDDWQLPVNLTGNLNAGRLVDVPGPATAENRYGDRVRLQWYPGAYFSNPSSSPVGQTVKTGIFAEAPSFTSNMNFNGLAVLFARFEWKEIKTQADSDTNPFGGGIPVVQVSMLGRRVASLLIDSESYTYDSAPVRYSTNPAEILLDYLRNPRYGKGLLNSDIHWDSWKKSAAKCNTVVTYLNTTSDITGPILTCNYVLDTGATIMNNVKVLLMGFRAYMPYIQGKYKLRIEDAGNETDITSGVATITMTAVAQPFLKSSYVGNVCDIVGNITYTGIDKGAKATAYAVTYVDPDQKFSTQQVIYPESEAERQIYIDKDGGRENKLDATFPTLTNYAMAKDMARLLFNKSRRQETCSLTISSEGLELEPGDSIRIQSNILNFGSDPWRIISLKVNDNMTVDIACVRNPDDIYPYVRAGEEDIVLAVYVPKGSIIYYPGSSNTPLLGLVPPTHAVYPEVVVPAPINPGPTDPVAPGGGGVGNVTVPTVDNSNSTVNNTPVAPPPPPPFDATLTFKSTKYNKNDLSTGLFTVTFTQPSAALYDYSLLWWRPNIYTAWTQVRLETKPGAGGDIAFTVGPLSNLGQYEYYVRCFATDGRASSNVLKGTFQAVQSQTVAGLLLGTGGGVTIAVTEGWTVPASQVPTAPVYNDNIDFLEIRPTLTAGVPSSPRRLKLTMAQLLYTFASPVNPLITGLFVYYKYRDETFWQREELLIPANKSLIETITWDLAGDFGSPAYPNSALTSATAFQSYDFIVRLKYADGTTAQKQIGPGRGLVEQSGTPPFIGSYDFPVFGTEATATASLKSTVIPSNFQLPLASQQDPAVVADTSPELMPNFFTIRANNVSSIINFRFTPPSSSKFRGYRLRYRPVQAGSDPDFITVDISSTPQQDGKIYFDLSSNYQHSNKYEWMISVLYRDSVGNTLDATNCWYAIASIPFGVPSGTELLNNYFNFETKDTQATLGVISAAFPAVATIIPQKWIKRQLVKAVSTDTNIVAGTYTASAGDVRRDSTGQPRINTWYRLQFQTPNDTFTNLVVYRRVYNAQGAARTTVGQFSKYWGLGAWEKIVIPRASLTFVSSKVYVVDVRGPISWWAFNNKTTGGLWNPIYGPTGNYPGPGYGSLLQLSQMYPYYGTGNAIAASGNTAEFLFVLDDGGEGSKGARLTEFYTDTTGANYKQEVDGIQFANQPRDDYRNISDYNTFEAGLNRNINEALTGVTVFQMTGDDFGRFYPRINSSFNGWSFYLNPPAELATIY